MWPAHGFLQSQKAHGDRGGVSGLNSECRRPLGTFPALHGPAGMLDAMSAFSPKAAAEPPKTAGISIRSTSRWKKTPNPES